MNSPNACKVSSVAPTKTTMVWQHVKNFGQWHPKVWGAVAKEHAVKADAVKANEAASVANGGAGLAGLGVAVPNS